MLDLVQATGADGGLHEELILADRYLAERFDPSRLREMRKERGLSQERLGQRTGQTRVTIVQYESGRHTPRGSTLHALARALDVDVTELLRRGPVDLPVLRLRRNLTQTDVANALGVSQAWYHYAEVRRVKVNRSQIRRLAQILDVDEDSVAKLVLIRE